MSITRCIHSSGWMILLLFLFVPRFAFAQDVDGDGFTEAQGDCDDTDANVHPDATENYVAACSDDVDNDCDGNVDQDDEDCDYVDVDGDGCSASVDCDDRDDMIMPGATEICGDGIDQDCDGQDEVCQTDDDGDGYTETQGDCDDTKSWINPGQDEVCNGADDNCDGVIDIDAVNAPTWYYDNDDDGYGNPNDSWDACSQPCKYVANADDCNDWENLAWTGRDEDCDGIDNDCDSVIDEDPVDGTTFYADVDDDGAGDPLSTTSQCSLPTGYTANSDDCDDTDASLNVLDVDLDGWTTCDGDCNDGDDTIRPGWPETCDGVDEDCDGQVDESPTDGTTFYVDSDGDGFGSTSSSTVACSAPSGYVTDNTDCADADDTIFPRPHEMWIGEDVNCTDDVDNDCDGSIDELDWDCGNDDGDFAGIDIDGNGQLDDPIYNAVDAFRPYDADSNSTLESVCNKADVVFDTDNDQMTTNVWQTSDAVIQGNPSSWGGGFQTMNLNRTVVLGEVLPGHYCLDMTGFAWRKYYGRLISTIESDGTTTATNQTQCEDWQATTTGQSLFCTTYDDEFCRLANPNDGCVTTDYIIGIDWDTTNVEGI